MNVVIMMQRQKSAVESLINALKVELLVAMVFWHDILFAAKSYNLSLCALTLP